MYLERPLAAQPNDESRNLLRLMSGCPMSFAHVSCLMSHVKTRDGNAMMPLGQVKSNQDCFWTGGPGTRDMRRGKTRDDKTLHVGMDRKNIRERFAKFSLSSVARSAFRPPLMQVL